MSVELYANQPQTVVSTGGTTTTDTTFTVATPGAFQAASSSATPKTYFAITDVANTSEIMYVTNVSGSTWTVLRAQEGTTAVAHSSGWTARQLITAGSLQGLKNTPGATSAVTLNTSTTETVIATYQPPASQIVAGATFEAIAYGTFNIGGTTRPTLTWRLRWGGVTGTILAQLQAGSVSPANSPVFPGTTLITGASFDVNGTVTLTDATHAVANLNWFYTNSTNSISATSASSTTANTNSANGQSQAGPVAVSGSGPLVLTAQWGTSAAFDTLTAVAPVIYRAA